MNDRTINNKIQESLLADERLSGSKIQTSVRNGVAKLEGRVQSYGRALAAQEIATRAPGCKGVYCLIEVEPVGFLPDREVAALVKDTLEEHQDLKPAPVDVRVRRGYVTLVGAVGSDRQRQLASDIAMGVPGVHHVKNLLGIQASATTNILRGVPL